MCQACGALRVCVAHRADDNDEPADRRPRARRHRRAHASRGHALGHRAARARPRSRRRPGRRPRRRDESPGAESPDAEPPDAEPPDAEPPDAESPGDEPPCAEPPDAEPPDAEPPEAEPSETMPAGGHHRPGRYPSDAPMPEGRAARERATRRVNRAQSEPVGPGARESGLRVSRPRVGCARMRGCACTFRQQTRHAMCSGGLLNVI